jgi:nucleoid-associated protein YgaU
VQRYEEFAEVIKASQGKRRYSTLRYPRFELRSSDIYLITKKTDRLDLLAFSYYGDVRYWVIIAKANKLHNATLRVPVGMRLRIPFPLNSGDVQTLFNDAQF